jgi:hypothetical protein
MQLYIVFGQFMVSVDVPLQSTVREAVSSASRKLGVIIYDYYIIYSSRNLELDETLKSQRVLPGSSLMPRGRLRGGVPQRYANLVLIASFFTFYIYAHV